MGDSDDGRSEETADRGLGGGRAEWYAGLASFVSSEHSWAEGGVGTESGETVVGEGGVVVGVVGVRQSVWWRRRRTRKWAVRAGVCAAVAVALFLIIWFASKPTLEALEDAFEGVRNMRLWGHVVVVGLFALAAFSPLPVYAILILASGFPWGFVLGAVTAWVGAMTWGHFFGILVRYGLFERAHAFIHDVRLLEAVNMALSSGGRALKFMTIVRWTPAPFWTVNTVLALTETPFWMYTVGFVLGETPNIVVLALAGSQFSSVGAVFRGETTVLQVVVFFVTIGISVIVAPILAVYTRREFRRIGINIDGSSRDGLASIVTVSSSSASEESDTTAIDTASSDTDSSV